MIKHIIKEDKNGECNTWEMPAVQHAQGKYSSKLMSGNRSLEDARVLEQKNMEQAQRDALEQSRKEIEVLKEQLRYTCDLLQKPLQMIEAHVEKEILHFVLLLTQQCLQQEITLAPEKIMPIIESLKQVLEEHSGKKSLHLHPEDAAIVVSNFQQSNIDLTGIDIINDPELHRGECTLHAPQSTVTSTVVARLKQICIETFTESELKQSKPDEPNEPNEPDEAGDQNVSE